MAIRILLADDHPVVRSGIRNELARHPDIEIVGEAVNGDETLRLVEALQPDVLILDIYMPGPKMVKIVRTLRAAPVSPRILILTAHGDAENVVQALKAGVDGYLLKEEDATLIAEGVRAVVDGKTWLSTTVARSLVGRMIGESEPSQQEPLSERELEVTRLIGLGYTNPQIAEALSISEGTVKNHVTSIYSKLRLHTRAETVVWAWQHGLVSDLQK